MLREKCEESEKVVVEHSVEEAQKSFNHSNSHINYAVETAEVVSDYNEQTLNGIKNSKVVIIFRVKMR